MASTVTIIYKSGAKVVIKVDRFTVIRRGNGNISCEWEGAIPSPLLIGVDDIAAIYEGHV